MKLDPSVGYERLIRSLEMTGDVGERERELIRALPLDIRVVARDGEVVAEGAQPKHSCLLIDGWLYRQKAMANGRRAILAFHLPGDIPDLQSLHLTTMDHSLTALTRCTVAYIAHEALRRACQQSEQLLHLLWRRTLIDSAIFREWLASATQQPAEQRLARLFCEVFYRMRAWGSPTRPDFSFRRRKLSWPMRSACRRCTSTACCKSCAATA